MANNDHSVLPCSSNSNSSLMMRGLWETGSSFDSTSDYYNANANDDAEAIVAIKLVETRLLDMVERLDDSDHNESQQEQRRGAAAAAAVKPRVLLPSHIIHKPHAYPCADTYKVLPSPPSQWPQGPLMLRPTPNANMKIRGIRHAASTEYQTFPGICAGCLLPVNTGREAPGESLVIDFESPLFVGTMLMRVAGAVPAVENNNYDLSSSSSYFDGKKRKFQVVVKGRFKQSLPVSQCVTGQVFERPAGRLPARWIVKTFIKFVSALAPQLEAQLDGDQPRFLTPLAATAHTVLAKKYSNNHNHHHDSSTHAQDTTTSSFDSHDDDASVREKLVSMMIYSGSTDMDEPIEEPPSDDPTSMLQTVLDDKNNAISAVKAAAGPQSSLTQRRYARKRTFNHIAAAHAESPVFDTNQEYTFEFFQHLLELTDPDDFKINIMTMMPGASSFQVGLSPTLNGQPIKILAAVRKPSSPTADADNNKLLSSVLWSFDLWHQALYPYAQQQQQQQQTATDDNNNNNNQV